MKKIQQKLGLLFALYFCQGLPGGFLSEALPVILRQQGLSLTAIGFTSFLSLPWVLKLLWAPLVDKYHIKKFGKRKSWIVPAHIGIILSCVVIAFLSPVNDLFYIALFFLVLNFFAATQDIGVDGFAVDILEKDEMGPGNTAQISGFKLGNLVGGGVLLSLSAYLGWSGNFIIMSFLIFCAMLLLLSTNEKEINSTREEYKDESKTEAVLKKLIRALKKQGLPFLLFIMYVRFSEVLGVAMIKPMLSDHKFTLPQIGVLDGTFGSLSVILGGIVAGIVCKKKGWHISLAVFTPLQGLALMMFGIYSNFDVSMFGAGVIVGLEKFFGGCVGVSIFSLGMSRCTKEVGASEFTAIQVIYMLGGYLAYPLSGMLADLLHYTPVMVSSGILAIMVAPMALKTYRNEIKTQSK